MIFGVLGFRAGVLSLRVRVEGRGFRVLVFFGFKGSGVSGFRVPRLRKLPKIRGSFFKGPNIRILLFRTWFG